jgi:hypothetical protein
MAQTEASSREWWRELPWKKATQNFLQAELISVLFWSFLGAMAAGLVRLLASDKAFDAFLISSYLPPAKRFDEPARYFPFLRIGAAALALIAIIRLPPLVKRGAKSWLLGVTSGLKLLSFAAAFSVLSLPRYSLWHQLSEDLMIVLAGLAAACALRCLAIRRQSRVPDEADIRVPLAQKRRTGRSVG